MKVLCTISHETQGSKPGKYRVFIGGEMYEADEIDPAFCSSVYGATEAKESKKPTAIEAVNKIKIAEVDK